MVAGAEAAIQDAPPELLRVVAVPYPLGALGKDVPDRYIVVPRRAAAIYATPGEYLTGCPGKIAIFLGVVHQTTCPQEVPRRQRTSVARRRCARQE